MRAELLDVDTRLFGGMDDALQGLDLQEVCRLSFGFSFGENEPSSSKWKEAPLEVSPRQVHQSTLDSNLAQEFRVHDRRINHLQHGRPHCGTVWRLLLEVDGEAFRKK